MASCRRLTMLALLLPLCGCSALGDLDVNVEGGNQAKGTMTRPLSLTLADDETVVRIAQRICDRVKPDSEANVYFVGKVPGPNAIDLATWGKYRYECLPYGAPAQAHAAAPAAPVPGAAASPTPESPAASAAVAAASQPARAGAADPPAADARQRQCLQQLGAYDLCLGSCLLTSKRPTDVLAAECQQSCASKSADCK